MPKVTSKGKVQKFPYTKAGEADAKADAKKTGGKLDFLKNFKKKKGK